MNPVQQFELAAERTAVGPPPWSVDESSGPLLFRCDLTAMESLACAFTRFEMSNSAWAAAPIEKVKQVAENLAQKLTYLLEPIRPIETDTEECVVQMRSSPPRKNEDGSIYYELHVKRGGMLSLCRYEKQPGNSRQAITIQVTREVFRNLLADFATAQ
jgi:hypothetical protein